MARVCLHPSAQCLHCAPQGPCHHVQALLPPKPEDAMSYLEMWAGFAVRHMVPDPFQHLFEATGLSYNPLDTCDAMLGYGIVHRMANVHDGVLDRHAIHTFLVTPATFERTL
jgi:hypothetical protein